MLPSCDAGRIDDHMNDSDDDNEGDVMVMPQCKVMMNVYESIQIRETFVRTEYVGTYNICMDRKVRTLYSTLEVDSYNLTHNLF